jgi:hypothetical protein
MYSGTGYTGKEMTRKDYLLIVKWINVIRIGVERHGDITLKCTFSQWVDSIATDLAADNHLFDIGTFFGKCNVPIPIEQYMPVKKGVV